MENKIKCPRCGKEKHQNKHGKNKLESKRYLCKHCNKAYTVNLKERKYSEDKIKEAIKLYMEGNSGRAVGRIMGISKNTCLYWIKRYTKTIEEKTYPNERVKVIEIDEVYSFIERKKQNLCDDTCK